MALRQFEWRNCGHCIQPVSTHYASMLSLGRSVLIFSWITPGFTAAGAALFDVSEQFLASFNLADVSPPHAACSPEDCCLLTYIRCRMSC